jgi:hypothetical protein
MPCYLEETDLLPEVSGFKSVLIVPCRFCPAASMAVSYEEPYIEFPRRLLKTDSYERLIKSMKSSFESRGIQTAVFESHLLHQFVLCMWTAKRRRRLLERARTYEALVVIGCEAAVETVREAVKSAGCRVIQGMETRGIMSIQPRFRLPCTIQLELQGVSPMVFPEQQSLPTSLGVEGRSRCSRGGETAAGAGAVGGAHESSLRSQRNTLSASR